MRTYPLFSGLLALGLLASCAQYEDLPSHDQYPSTRIAQGLEDIRTALRSSAEGWDLVLIPDGGNFGGINLSMRFTSASEVVMSSEAYQKGGTIPSVVTNPQSDLEAVTKTEFGSTYHLTDRGGIQLTFDTFNVALHSWSNPGWGVPDSYNGDFTFRVDSISRDRNTIYLQGARTKTPMRLTRRSSGDKDQLQRCFAMKQELQGKALAPITLGGKQYELSIFGFARQLSLRSGGKEELLPFHYTPQGIELLRPYVAGSDSLTALHLSADKQSMTTADGRQKLALYQGDIDLTRRYMQLYFYDRPDAGAGQLPRQLHLHPAPGDDAAQSTRDGQLPGCGLLFQQLGGLLRGLHLGLQRAEADPHDAHDPAGALMVLRPPRDGSLLRLHRSAVALRAQRGPQQ